MIVPGGTRIEDVLAAAAVAVLALAGPRRSGLPVVVAGQVLQRVVGVVGRQEDAAAVAAVAAVGAAVRNELLAPERDAPVAAAPAGDDDVHLVEEHRLGYRGFVIHIKQFGVPSSEIGVETGALCFGQDSRSLRAINKRGWRVTAILDELACLRGARRQRLRPCRGRPPCRPQGRTGCRRGRGRRCARA